MKFSTKACIVAALAAAFTFAGPSAYAGRTWAKEINVNVCVDTPLVAAYVEVVTPAIPGTELIPAVTVEGWQRYSWTGGPHDEDDAPAFPSADWQANTASDPHGIGVAGAYYRSNGNSGKGDWFYLEATVTVVTPEVPATPATPAVVINHPEVPAVVCPPVDVDTPVDTPPVVTPPVDKPEKPSKGTSSVSRPEKPSSPDKPTYAPLPHTGAEEWALALVGLGLLCAGIGVVTFYRKR